MADLVTSSDFWRGRRVLLTGHTGFKGAWLALWLEQLGAKVFGVSLPPTASAIWDQIGRPGDRLGFIDIRDTEALGRAFDTARPDIVLHLAAQALVHPSYERPAETFEINVVGLANVLDASRASETVEAIVNVTSDKCYENREHLWAYREDEAMGGSDPYSASKGCAELVTASYRRSYFSRSDGARLASARAGNVIGGGDWSADRLIPDCVRAFSRAQTVRIRNPLAVRPWQHVLEPLSGYMMLAQMLVEKGQDFAEGWNFGPADDDAWAVQKIVETFSAEWGGEACWEADNREYAKEAFLLRVDASKAKALLKWESRLRIQDALAWSAEWYKKVLGGGDARAITLRQIELYEGLARRQ